MSIEIKVPDLPESVADATIAAWHKQPGETIERDEVIVDIETDKVVLEVAAQSDGVLEEILVAQGETVLAQELIGRIAACPIAGEETKAKVVNERVEQTQSEKQPSMAGDINDELSAPSAYSPSVRRLMQETNTDVSQIAGTGHRGRLQKSDITRALVEKTSTKASEALDGVTKQAYGSNGRKEQRVPMTRLRKRIAERLLEAKNTTAMLTTFNEVNMQPIMNMRAQYQDKFEKRHGVRLGFMSFYVKAVVEALKRFPVVNASIDGEDIVYHNFFDISIAVSTPRGLVTPVLRDCDTLSMAQIEAQIKELAVKGRDGKLTVDELTGGNFTITNGGVFGSLMSTPIINPPQSAILGMHKIQDRPMAVNGEVKILPMMYLALSYDHQIIDGKDSVSFLVTIKELLEDPARLLLEV